MQSGYQDALSEAERLREEVKSLREEMEGKKEAKKKQEAALKEAKTQQQSLKQKSQALEAEVNVSSCGNDIGIGAGGLGFDSLARRIRHTVANSSPPLRRFFGVLLTKR